MPHLQTEFRESPVVLTLAGSVVYCNTNHGLVAALRVRDGQLLWMVTYPRSLKIQEAPLHGDLGKTNACLFSQGLLLIAPTDSRELLAFDAASGKRVWSRLGPPPAVNLLGALGDRLILSGDRLWAIDRVTGELVPGWGDKTAGWGQPQSEAGEGLIDGQRVYWPAQGRIWTLDGSQGWPTALTIESMGVEPVADLPKRARLLMAGDKLIAAGPRRITVYQVAAGSSQGNSKGVDFGH